MEKSSFCKIIRCPHVDHFYLKNFRCAYKNAEIGTLACIFLDAHGEATTCNIFLNSRHSEVSPIQIIAALVKSNGRK
jgi:hypothetical protein